jgi:hypothetical protein
LRTETWQEVADLMLHLIKNPEQLYQYHSSIMGAWMQFKEHLRKKVHEWAQ